MEFRLFNIDDIDYTRIVKFLRDFFIKDSYQIKKIGIPSANEYIIKFISGIETTSLSKYLKSQKYDFTLKENKITLTPNQKQLVKEYIQRLKNKRTLNEAVNSDALEEIFSSILDSDNLKDNIQAWKAGGSWNADHKSKIDYLIRDIKKLIKDASHPQNYIDVPVAISNKVSSFYKDQVDDSSNWDDPGVFISQMRGLIKRLRKDVFG